MAEIECLPLWNDVLRLQTFRPLLDFELDLLSFIQRLVTVALNGGKMDEYILARLALNEPKTFRTVKPLSPPLPFAHGIPLLLIRSQERCFLTGSAYLVGRSTGPVENFLLKRGVMLA